MVTRDEKQRLLHDFDREPVWSLGMVLKCAGCLLFLTGIAVFGPGIDTRWESNGNAQAASGSAQQRAAVVEAGDGLDAKRARLDTQSMAPQSQVIR